MKQLQRLSLVNNPDSSAELVTVCITRSGQESYLCSEIRESLDQQQRVPFIQCTHNAPQTVVLTHNCHKNLCSLPLFFSARCLPQSQGISATSVSTLAAAVLDRLIDSFGESSTPWCLHVFEPSSVETGEQYSRPLRLHDAILNLLKQKRRSYLRALRQTVSGPETLVQVVLVEPNRGYISIADPELRSIYRSALTPTWAGHYTVPDDKRPPSRAFKKLKEAIDVFSLILRKGDTAVDLGASPGGWTYVLREYGLSVIAIDRSPLADALMRDRGVVWSSGDALSWPPPQPVTWLVCDVITSPENTARLLQNWIKKKLCANFCVTVKFKGPPAIESLISLSAFLRNHTRWFDGRQLTHNKNELTIVGAL